MKQKLKIISCSLVAGLFLLIAFGSGRSESNKVNIQSEQEIKSYLLGKWKANLTLSGMVVFYRFEITDSQIKCWKKSDATMAGAGAGEWAVNPDEVIDYNIGALEADTYGNKFRLIGKNDFGDIFISGNRKDDMSFLTIGKSDFDYNSTQIYPTKGWE